MRSQTLRKTERMGRRAGAVTGFLRQLQGESGNDLVEYAMVLIIFLSILFGIVGFGQALYAYHFVATAAKEAARYAAVRGSTCANDLDGGSCQSSNSASGVAGPTTQSDVSAFVTKIAPPGIDTDPSRLAATLSFPPQPTNPTACAAKPDAPGCTVEVQVTYSFKFPVAFISSATLPMSSSAEMVIVH